MSLLEEMFDGQQEPLNERPYSRSQSAIDSAKGKVKGMFGSGQVEQGAQETGQQANQLWNDFKRYIGKKYGSHPQAVSFGDVANFFKGNKLDTSFLGTNERRSFSPKDVGAALMKAVQKANSEYPDEEKPQGQPQPQQQGQEEQPQGQQPTNEPPAGNSSFGGELSALSPEDRAKLLRLIS